MRWKIAIPLKVAAMSMAALVPNGAQAEVFACDVKNHGPYLMIADKIVFDVDTRSHNVLVADGVLAYFEQLPAAGTLKRYNDKTVIVTWTLQASVGNGTHSGVPEDVTYRAVVNRKSKAVTVSAYFDPIDQVKATGSCESAKSKLEKTQNRPEQVEGETQSSDCDDYSQGGAGKAWNC